MQTPEEFVEDFREWMVVNAQWPMLGDANAPRKLEQITRARDAEIKRGCAERAEEWRVNLGPGDDEASTLHAAIIGEEE